jgi:hypothetical protein
MCRRSVAFSLTPTTPVPVVQRRDRAGHMRAVVVLVGVPPAGAGVVFAGDVDVVRQVLVAPS